MDKSRSISDTAEGQAPELKPLAKDQLTEIANFFAKTYVGGMPEILRRVVDALHEETFNSRRDFVSSLVSKLQYMEMSPVKTEKGEQKKSNSRVASANLIFFAELLFDQMDDFYAALRALIPADNADHFLPKIHIYIQAPKPKPVLKAKKDKPREKKSIEELVPDWCKERIRALLAKSPELPIKFGKVGSIADEQKKALAEVFGLLLATGQGREVPRLTGIRADRARAFLQQQKLAEHASLPRLREEVAHLAADYKNARRKIDETAKHILAVYVRLDAELGGVAFRSLPEELGVTAGTLGNWIKPFQQTPTEKLLTALPEAS